MVYKYKRSNGSRRYKSDYSDKDVKEAVAAIKCKRTSIQGASRKYGIPFGTLRNRLVNAYTKSAGGQTALSTEVEALIASAVQTVYELQVPLDRHGLARFVQIFLNKRGQKVSAFKDNLPGKDWIRGFKIRHNLTLRKADNVKPRRVEVSVDARTGFGAAGVKPFDPSQDLDKLPSASSAARDGRAERLLNETDKDLLEDVCYDKKAKKAQKRGRKVTPDKPITAKKRRKTRRKASVNTAEDILDLQWSCFNCGQEWAADGNDRWIVCDHCDKQYHLQCSGIKYLVHNYYHLNIQSIPYQCPNCQIPIY